MSSESKETEVTSSKEALIPEGFLPAYLSEAFADLYEEDGLLVMGKGLGCLSLLAAFCRFYGDEDNKFVVVLGLRESEWKSVIAMLESWGTAPERLPIVLTNESKDRSRLYYRKSGVFIITSRILIVDLLTSVVKPGDVDSLLIYNAESVTEQSTPAFIIRIIHMYNPKASIKALSEAPDSLMSGFAKIDKILKSLRVRHIFLYPRFHEAVRSELEATPPIVEELHQSLTPTMIQIQMGLAAAVQTCFRELKKNTPLVDWSGEQVLSLENCVTQQFDRAISRQLEPDWHRLKPQTKQYVQDLRQLRTLFTSLLQDDCIKFYNLLHAIQSLSKASRTASLWLLTPAANVIFTKAKERLYRIHSPSSREVSKLIPFLEPNPKWKCLKQVLEEIDANHKEQNLHNATTLVMCQSEQTLETLRDYLVEGEERTMNKRWLRHLERINDRSRSLAGNQKVLSEESRLLVEEEGRVRNFLFGRNRGRQKGSANQRRRLNEIPDYQKKRRRIAKEQGRGVETAEDLERQAVLDEAMEETKQMDATPEPVHQKACDDEAEDEEYRHHVSVPSDQKIVLKTYNSLEGDQALMLLRDLRPTTIVLYDIDPSFVRSVEIYAACNRTTPLKVYFLILEASAEEKNFRNTLQREQDAFERLIHHKKTMPPPMLQNVVETQEMQQALSAGTIGGTYTDATGNTLPLAFDTRSTRKGGTGNKNAPRRDICVDVREFRSSLPSILHQGGMRIAPVTLTVGDFVLSNVHCVERKSISDLFGSFQSGRLYTQAESMSKYYKCPCLLIEFDPEKSFCLQNSNELGGDIKTDSVCSKIALLTMHFPKLRILWSKSPHETLRLFRELKANHDEVNVEKAVEIGRSESAEALLEDDRGSEDSEVNEAARDMLLRLPGVNAKNARKIMSECESLAELSAMSREELRRIAGPVGGQKLFTFFRQKMAAI